MVEGTDAPSSRLTSEQAQIAQTRAAMGATLDRLQDELEPAHLVEQAAASVEDAASDEVKSLVVRSGEAARNLGQSLVKTARRFPLPTAALGLALLWLWRRGRGRDAGNDEADNKGGETP